MKTLFTATFAALLGLGLSACEQKGPLEQAGEEVDEAVDTVQRGGEESTSTRVDDAMDEARKGANETAEELKE